VLVERCAELLPRAERIGCDAGQREVVNPREEAERNVPAQFRRKCSDAAVVRELPAQPCVQRRALLARPRLLEKDLGLAAGQL
jgi:hypothetical protein